jgi:hypothetical protein
MVSFDCPQCRRDPCTCDLEWQRLCTVEPGADCPLHPMTVENQRVVQIIATTPEMQAELDRVAEEQKD